MSAGGAVGSREVAVRCFAAEYDDATLEYSEGDEERAPNYVVTPTGARINRLFVVGVLTEVESVSDEVLRGRVVDPTGAFVVYAGQYQPDAKAALERTETPAFVAVTGKARTFRPDDGDRVYTSVRPESVTVVDADTRDRWTVQAAARTLDRVGTCAAALARGERGDALAEVLRESDVDQALAAGIPRAIDHYGTTEGYLAAVRRLALQAAEVVAGEREEVEALEVAPDDGGSADVDLAADVPLAATAGGADATRPASVESGADGSDRQPDAGGDATQPSTATGAAGGDAVGGTGAESGTEAAGANETGEPAVESTTADASDGRASTADESDGRAPTGEPDTAEAGADEAATAELYEMDEAEREAVEAEFGTDFETGNEVDAPGEADIETPGIEESDEADAAESGGPAVEAETAPEGAAGAADAAAPAPAETETETEPEAAEGARGDEAEPASPDEEPGDLVDAAVAAMDDLDDGAGADRAAVVEAVASARGVDDDAVQAAIQEALMGGRCYEPDDGLLKAI